MNEVKIAAIIPARMASSRYPGKPLIEIEGLPMIEHVRRRTLLCKEFSDVVVATCDQEIYDTVKKYDGNVMMTSHDHIMASDRVAEAAEHLDCTHVINVQGDEILVLPEDLAVMVDVIMVDAINSSPEKLYWNATASIETEEELGDTSIVKCVLTAHGKIMYCARDFSSLEPTNGFDPVHKILGILGYTRESLNCYKNLPRTPLEVSQSIDQSRIIENDLELFSVPFSGGYPGINEPREVEMVNTILKTDSRQKQVLHQIVKSYER